MNILIVDDEPAIARFVQKILLGVHMSNIVDIALDFHEAFSKSFSNTFDVILIDIDLESDSEGGDGIDLCHSIRSRNENVVIIMLTGFRSIEYLQRAFLAGANDYITKPFRPKELGIRVERWKQFSGRKKVRNTLCYKELSYQVERNEFFYGKKKLHLTKKNKELLLLFLKNPESLLSARYIQEKFWGDNDDMYKNRNLRSNIHLLRSSLENICDTWIQTVRGEGYMLHKNLQKKY